MTGENSSCSSESDVAGRYESVLVNQATGMVMAQLGIGPHDAIVTLREVATATQRTVDDVAADVITGVLRPYPADRTPSDETPATH